MELGACETLALLSLCSFQLPSFVYLLEFHSSKHQVCIVVISPWSFCGLFSSKQMYWAFSVAEMIHRTLPQFCLPCRCIWSHILRRQRRTSVPIRATFSVLLGSHPQPAPNISPQSFLQGITAQTLYGNQGVRRNLQNPLKRGG